MQKTFRTTGGTSFHGTAFSASVNDLKKVLGEPDYAGNDGSDKVNFEWEMETEAGDVFTVYDWKEYRVLDEDESIVWHIGGLTSQVTDAALNEIASALEEVAEEPALSQEIIEIVEMAYRAGLNYSKGTIAQAQEFTLEKVMEKIKNKLK